MRELLYNKSALLGFLVIFMSNPLWPFWGFFGVFAYFIFPALFFLYLIVKNRGLKVCVNGFKLFVLFAYIFVFLCLPLLYKVRLSSYTILLTYLSICMLDENDKRLILSSLTRFLAVVITISLPFWLIHVFVLPLPMFGVLDSILAIKDIEPMHNYILFVTNGGIEDNRFYSMFDEPGVLGTLSAFVLYGNKFNFKRRDNLIILIGAIFTFSLAFYLLFVIGFILYHSKKVIHFFIAILSIFVLGIVLYLLLKDNLTFQYSIIERFSDVDTKMATRSSKFINDYFESYIFSKDAIWGLGTSFFSDLGWSEGSSYKDFLLEYGIVGGITLVVVYITLMGKITRYTLVLLFLFLLSFLQRPIALTSWQILLFSCCCANLRYSEKLNK